MGKRARQAYLIAAALAEVARTARALAAIEQCPSSDPATGLRCELLKGHHPATDHAARPAANAERMEW